MDDSTPITGQYRKDIDGLRALAVLSVLFYHIQPHLLPGGYLGVDVFFVISGYLITRIILREHHQQCFSFIQFYSRRFKRIFPALFVVLLLSALVSIVFLTPETYPNFMTSGRYAAAQISNFLFAKRVGYFDQGFSGQPLLHTWSLGVEEQFYLLWPLLIAICFFVFKATLVSKVAANKTSLVNNKIAIVFALLAITSFSVCYHLTTANYNRAFYMFYARAFEFCIGGALALNLLPNLTSKIKNIFVSGIGLALLIFSFLFVGEEFLGRSFLQFSVLVPCIGTALIIYANQKSNVDISLLSSKVPVYIGKISYSLYLYHWPIIIFWKLSNGIQMLSLIDSVIIIVVSILVASLSYHFVEQPVRKSRVSNAMTIATSIFVIIVFASMFEKGEEFSESEWRIARNEDTSLSRGPQWENVCTKHSELLYDCQDSAIEQIPKIALIGDSHAPNFIRSTLMWAKTNGYNVKYIAVQACPLLLGEFSMHYTMLDNKDLVPCDRALTNLESEILDDSLVEAVLIAHRLDLFHDGAGFDGNIKTLTFKDADGVVVKDHAGFYKNLLSKTAAAIKSNGKRVIMVKQVPLNIVTDTCKWETLGFRWFNQSKKCLSDDDFVSMKLQPSRDFIDDIIQENDLYFIDPVLSVDREHSTLNSFYRDTNHLNNYGKSNLIPMFGLSMDLIMSDKPRF